METNNVYIKLVNIQSTLKAPKSQFNSFGKYNYRSCEDILEGLKPILKEEKALVILDDKVVQIGTRFYVEATATLIDAETGEKVSAKALAREDETKKGMDLAQVTGSVSSYARKYALNGLFCIDDTKDSDATNTHGKEQKKEKLVKMN
ncbi:TPA: ERF family protein [Clostridioides difficile]|uniref:ERF family protein n=1 Tax=Clostridioides difficile TaxID=1496 RepID=UPI0003108D83